MASSILLIALVTIAATVSLSESDVSRFASQRLLSGDYCRLRPGAVQNKCCGGRLDDCSVPILDTLCYCDEFCDRDDNDDCCPDYWTFCRGRPTPIPPTPKPIPPAPILNCFYKGTYYTVGQTTRLNCNSCTCRALSESNAELICEDVSCLIQPDIIDTINHGNYGWRASNYSFFWGKSLDEGYQKRLGACEPDSSVTVKAAQSRTYASWRNVIDQNSLRPVMNGEILELEFDSRRQWPGFIQSIHDQGDFPSSWAISTVDLAADRLAIQSDGLDRVTFSAQSLISCVTNRNNRCESGSTDRAWWHLSMFGVVSDECYPYTSGSTKTKGKCFIERNKRSKIVKCPVREFREGIVYRSSPAYRISKNEEEIMKEIKTNGPVQAIFKVKDDFFLYKSGVYRHTRLGNQHDRHHRHSFHAVRIIGWGVDRSHGTTPTNYWLCANSWGTEWGENGYFRIIRGQNECDIEMFVVGSWANTRYGVENRVSNAIANNHE